MVVLHQTEAVTLGPLLRPVEHEGVAGAELLAVRLTGGGVMEEGGVVMERLVYLLVHRVLVYAGVGDEPALCEMTQSRQLEREE